MTCSITVDWQDDSPSFYDAKMKKARKQHKCCECCGVINPGDEYEKAVGKWSGSFDSFKTCKVCKEIRDSIFCSWCHSSMWEDLSAETEDGKYFEYKMLDGLSLEAIDKIENYFGKWWKDIEEETD